MKKQPPSPDQLAFSYGRSLPVLTKEILKTSRNRLLRKAAQQTSEARNTLELLNQTGVIESERVRSAIQELLTK